MKKQIPSRKEKIKDFDIELQSHIDRKDVVKVLRKFKGREENVSGFILAMTKKFLLIEMLDDFLINGFSIIRKDQFDAIRCNKFDKTCKKILAAEGIFPCENGIVNTLNIKSWQNIFADLKKWDYHVIIELEDFDDPYFNIGPIKRVNKESVSINYYDPTGLLDNKLTTIDYTDITCVQFGDRYSTIFRKYLRKQKTKK